MERVEGEELLVRDNGIRARGSGRAAEYIEYCCTARGNRETTIVGKLATVSFFHKRWMARSLPLDHLMIKAVREGKKGRT